MKPKVYVPALLTFALLSCQPEDFSPAPRTPALPVILKTEAAAKLAADPGGITDDPTDPICINSRAELISYYQELATEMCQDLVVCIPACPGEPSTVFYTLVISHRCVYDAPSPASF